MFLVLMQSEEAAMNDRKQKTHVRGSEMFLSFTDPRGRVVKRHGMPQLLRPL